MRKFLITLLLAGAAATPAIAGPNDWSDRQQSREDRQQAREERQAARAEARSERSAEHSSYVAPARQEPRQQAVDRAQFNAEAMRAARDARRESFAGDRSERIEQVQERLQDRRQEMRDARDLRQSNRPVPNVMRNRHPLVVSDTPRPGTQPPLPSARRPTPAVQWSTNWRNNNRYNWQDYRHRHRSIFHLGFYYDPFGWGYYPYQIGWRMWPSYFGSRYWINDPWMYRLPYAPPGYRWIRYWNDAVLVDTWTGTVVDVIPGFFW